MSKRARILMYLLSYAIVVGFTMFGDRDPAHLAIVPAAWIVGYFILGPAIRLLFRRKETT